MNAVACDVYSRVSNFNILFSNLPYKNAFKTFRKFETEFLFIKIWSLRFKFFCLLRTIIKNNIFDKISETYVQQVGNSGGMHVSYGHNHT